MSEIRYRKIIHVDMDAFYASVEQRDFPELRGKPIAVGGSAERGVVMTASYEARKYGVKSAMPSSQAYRKCPQIIFVRPRFEIYQQISHKLRNIMKGYTQLIEPLSLDEAYLDVTENNASAVSIARSLKKEIFQETKLTASVGVSINKFLAKIASDYHKPNGISVIQPHQVASFIDQLDIKKFHGIGKVTADKLNNMGIYRGADLKRLSQQELINKFGKNGKYYYQIAHGIDHRPVDPHRIRKSVSVEDTFAEDLQDLEKMKDELQRLAERLVDWMEQHHIYGRTLTLKVKFYDFQQLTRSKTHPELIDNYHTLISLAEDLLLAFEHHKPIRLLGLAITNLNNQGQTGEKQLSLDL